MKKNNAIKPHGLRKFSLLVAFYFLLGSLSGCKTNPIDELKQRAYRDYSVADLSQSNPSQVETLLMKIKDQHWVSNACIDGNGDTKTCTTKERNTVVASLMVASDEMCQQHLKTIYGNEAAINISTGSFALLTSGIATAVSSAAAKTTWSALSTLGNAERSLINETVYKDRLVHAIVGKIRQSRDEQSKLLLNHFGDSEEIYPVMRALSDVTKYHYSCSFMYGLEKTLEEGSQPSTEIKRTKLEQERQQLENYLDIRVANDKLDKSGVSGAQARLTEIDKQLLALTTMDAMTNPIPEMSFYEKANNALNSIAKSKDDFDKAYADKKKAIDIKLGSNSKNVSMSALFKTEQKQMIAQCKSKLSSLYESYQGKIALDKLNHNDATTKQIEVDRNLGNLIAGYLDQLASSVEADEEKYLNGIQEALDKSAKSESIKSKIQSDVLTKASKDLTEKLQSLCKP